MLAASLQFRPPLLPTLLLCLLLPLFIALTLWQLERAAQKRELAATMQLHQQLPALAVDTGLPAVTSLPYRTLHAVGHFDAGRSVLLENRKHQGRSGFHLVTPLRVDATGKLLLVNRGWLAEPPDPARLAELTPSSQVRVTGRAVVPEPPAIALDWQSDGADSLPRWPYITLDRYRQWSGLALHPFLLLQQGDHPQLRRDWPVPPANDAMHLGYALQWAAFALIALLIWLRLSLSRRPAQENDHDA